jgi:hypothetical protein
MIDLIITIVVVLGVVVLGIWLFDEDDWQGRP